MFPNDAAEFVYYRTYSRWIDEKGRREAWPETTKRVIDFLKKHRGDVVPAKVFKKLEKYMLELSVLPSMRLVWAAGPAAESDNTTIYNCAFQVIDSIESFSETVYILMCGTGVGYSVERKYVEKLPVVKTKSFEGPVTVAITDDKKGWADSVKTLLENLYEGRDVSFDYSLLRKKGSRLKTMGGRSSGPEPLILLHGFIKQVLGQAQGRKLTPLECSDIMNEIAQIVVAGGVRRSSEISLSDLDDSEMRNAKVWPMPERRYMSNNSAVYLKKPLAVEFLNEWAALAASGTGERGIFNLDAARKRAPVRRDREQLMGTNPCGEIILRSMQFCNLSTVIVRPGDDLDDLLDKVECASWIGTIQASFTDFPYLRPDWKKNCDEERLLGVSISGQMDNPKALTKEALKALKARVVKVNRSASKLLGINAAAATTCVKPEGTSSQLTSSGSGVHPWYAPYFIRRYRISCTDRLFAMVKDQGLPASAENGQDKDNPSTWVVSFPVKAPEGAVFRDAKTAIEQLEWYKKVQENWCEHNCSITIYVKDNEWFEVGNWVYKNWDVVGGVSFLPYDGGHYVQAPYEAITEKQYNEMVSKFPKIDYNQLIKYEQEDMTEGAKSFACVGDKCELP